MRTPSGHVRGWMGAITLAAIASLPRSASANVPLPATFALQLPFWMSTLTFGVLFLAVWLIEAGLLKYLVRISWKKALLYSFAANAVSTLVGGALAGKVAASLTLLLLLFFIPFELHRRWGWSPKHGVGVAVFLLACFFALGAFALTEVSLTSWVIYVPLLLAFPLTVLIESLVIRRAYASGPLVKPVVLSNLASYTLLVVILVAVRFEPYDNPKLGVWSIQNMAVARARQGDLEGAVDLLRRAQRQHKGPFISYWFQRVEPAEPEYRYWAWGEQRVAKMLVEQKEFCAARDLIADTLALDLYESEYEKCRQELTELLAGIPDAPTSSAIAGLPPPRSSGPNENPDSRLPTAEPEAKP